MELKPEVQGKESETQKKIPKKLIIAGGTMLLLLLAVGMFLFGGEDEYYPPVPPPASVQAPQVPAQPAQTQQVSPLQQQALQQAPVQTSQTPQVARGAPQPASATSQPQSQPQAVQEKQEKKRINPEELVEKDVKLVGDCLKEAVNEAVSRIVSEERQKSEEELKKKWEEAVKSLQQRFSSLSDEGESEGEQGEKKQVSRTPMGEDMLPALIKASAKVVLPDGRILLSTPLGDLVKGALLSGWTVENIDDRFVYLKKTVVKKVPYKVKKTTPEGLTYYETKYRTVKELKHKKIPYVVEF